MKKIAIITPFFNEENAKITKSKAAEGYFFFDSILKKYKFHRFIEFI